MPENTKKMLAGLAMLVLLAVPLTLADDSDSDRGYLGVTLHFTESIHPDGHDGSQIHDAVGLFVGQALPGGPAELAGLQAGDKIVAIDGRDVSDMKGLREVLDSRRKGESVSVTVEREGREQTFGLVLGAMPLKKQLNVERFGMVVDRGEDRAFVGIESQPVGSQLARYFGVEGGILVTNVIEGGPAQEAGIEAGDVIVAWGDTLIRNHKDLQQLITEAKPDDPVDLAVSRRGAEFRLGLTLGSAKGYKKKHVEMLHEQQKGDMHFDEYHNQMLELKVMEKKSGGE